MLITKKWGIRADSGALCPYLDIKVTGPLQKRRKQSWLNSLHIMIFWGRRNKWNIQARKKWGIQADLGALCPYLDIKVTGPLQKRQKQSWLNFLHIMIFWGRRNKWNEIYRLEKSGVYRLIWGLYAHIWTLKLQGHFKNGVNKVG